MAVKKSRKISTITRKKPRKKSVTPAATAAAVGTVGAASVLATGATGASGGHPTGSPSGAGDPAQGPSNAARAAAQGPAAPATSGGTVVPTGGDPAGAGAQPAAGAGVVRAASPVSRLRKPRGNQAALAGTVAAEIRRSMADGTYRTVFGPHAPDPEQLATSLEHAGTATVTATRSEQAWLAARDERNHAWDATLTSLVDPFHACFLWAADHDASLVERFPSTAVFLQTGSTIGARSAATRRGKLATRPTPSTGG